MRIRFNIFSLAFKSYKAAECTHWTAFTLFSWNSYGFQLTKFLVFIKNRFLWLEANLGKSNERSETKSQNLVVVRSEFFVVPQYLQLCKWCLNSSCFIWNTKYINRYSCISAFYKTFLFKAINICLKLTFKTIFPHFHAESGKLVSTVDAHFFSHLTVFDRTRYTFTPDNISSAQRQYPCLIAFKNSQETNFKSLANYIIILSPFARCQEFLK